jgi:hypothetical protein
MVEGWHAMCVKWGKIGANEQSDGEHRLIEGQDILQPTPN